MAVQQAAPEVIACRQGYVYGGVNRSRVVIDQLLANYIWPIKLYRT